MKKLLTILLALLVVTGVVFADDPPAPPLVADGDFATLTLKSSVTGDFEHGFGKTKDATGLGLGDNEYTNITMTSSNVDLGFYVVKTNAAVAFGVDFTVNPMTSAMETATVYVPYTLNIAFEEKLGGRTFNNGENPAVAWATGVADTSIEPESDVWSESEIEGVTATVISHGTYGSGSLALALSADFGENNTNANLPEGDYVGTVVATITAN